MGKGFQDRLIQRAKWRLIVVTLLLVFTNNAFAQSCSDTHPNVHFQVGSRSDAPHFRTPEGAGEERCPHHGGVLSRAVKSNSHPSPYSWGDLFCDSNGNEFGVGHMFIGCCQNNEVLVDGICTVLADDADKDDGNGCNLTSNPCNVANGNKFRSEADVSLGGMSFARFYNSRNLVDLGLGKGWRHSHQKKLAVSGGSLLLISETGRGESWVKIGGVWQADSDSDYRLSETADGFEVTLINDAKENYNVFGQIMSETNPADEQTTYEYGQSGLLAKVTDHYGQSLAFNYAGVRLISVSNSAGEEYLYQYDADGNLTTVIFPDGTPADPNDNPRKIYHYESPSFLNHLTGITDENGSRYATFAYDENGKAITSELGVTSNAAGQQKIELDYQ